MKTETRKIVSAFAKINFPFALAQIDGKKTACIEARTMAAALLYFKANLTQVEIAQLLHKTQSSVSKLLARHLKLVRSDTQYQQKYRRYDTMFRI